MTLFGVRRVRIPGPKLGALLILPLAVGTLLAQVIMVIRFSITK